MTTAGYSRLFAAVLAGAASINAANAQAALAATQNPAIWLGAVPCSVHPDRSQLRSMRVICIEGISPNEGTNK
jgi:hypothetical protein